MTIHRRTRPSAAATDERYGFPRKSEVHVSATHTYEIGVTWTGNRGSGTSGYRLFDRDHDITAAGPSTIAGSADPAFRGDRSRWNPEQLLVAALSQCHVLWYLHLAADAGVVVTDYTDSAYGTMVETADGGHFVEVVLQPRATVVSSEEIETAKGLHKIAHERCFIANSVNFPVRHQPVVVVAGAEGSSPRRPTS